jgi:hypothetical protein
MFQITAWQRFDIFKSSSVNVIDESERLKSCSHTLDIHLLCMISDQNFKMISSRALVLSLVNLNDEKCQIIQYEIFSYC